jgi:hypothetical protein
LFVGGRISSNVITSIHGENGRRIFQYACIREELNWLSSTHLHYMLLAMSKHHVLVSWRIVVVISIVNYNVTLFFSAAQTLVSSMRLAELYCCTRKIDKHATCVLSPLQRRVSPREGLRGRSVVGLEGDFAIYI